jgi:hypothetical protein
MGRREPVEMVRHVKTVYIQDLIIWVANIGSIGIRSFRSSNHVRL